MERADLHLHTRASDGTDTVSDREKQAKEYDLDVIAITDHDSINPELEDRSYTAGNGVEVITGAEIKCEVEGIGIEILGYFLDPKDSSINSLLDQNSRYRMEKIRKMIDIINEEVDKEIHLDNVLERSDGNPGRPHVAAELVEKGIAEDQSDAFENFIGENCFGYIETKKVPAKKVISAVHENGGVTSLAHPGRDLNTENAEKLVRELKELGLDAIEVPYTYNEKRRRGYNISFGQMNAMELAEENNLLVSGGSDCHGSESDKYNIGKIDLPGRHLEALRARVREHR